MSLRKNPSQAQFDAHITRFSDLAKEQYLPERMGD